MSMLYEYRKRDGTSKFLIFPEFPIIRTFAHSNKKLSPLRVRINGCVLYIQLTQYHNDEISK